MVRTYSEESKINRLFLTLRDLGIDENTVFGLKHNKYDYRLLASLVLFTPTNQSHLGVKFASYSKINNNTMNNFLKGVFSGLGVKNVYLFSSYTEKTKKKNDLRGAILNDKETMICLRCDNGVLNSLFMAIRNSLAHGNIIEEDGFLELYSISDDKKEFDSAITFFLRIKQQSKLRAFFQTLNAYE